MAIIPGVYQAKNAISDDSQQGSKFNSIVNAIVNPANTSLLTGFDPVIEEVSSPNVGTVVTYIPHTVSGTPPLSLPNSAGQPLESWSVDVLPYQEGTGDPSPTNVRPIYGTDKLTITTAGENLADCRPAVESNGTYMNFFGGTYTVPVRKITVYAGWTYTLTIALTVPLETGYWGIYGKLNNGSTIALIPNNNDSSKTVNYTPTADGEMWFWGYASLNNFTDAIANGMTVMFNVGSTALPYQPYVAPSQTVLTLPQTVYTGTIGSEGGESRSATFVMDGDTSKYSQMAIWYTADAERDTLGIYWYFTYPGFSNLPTPAVSQTVDTGMADCLKWDKYGIYGKNTPYICGITGQNNPYFAIRLPKSVLADVSSEQAAKESAMAYLAEHPVTVVYDLATPTTFAVPSATIPTPTGSATTWATAEDGTVESMEVTYVGKA
jgi:hypothetical protein